MASASARRPIPSCRLDKFIYTEVLRAEEPALVAVRKKPAKAAAKKVAIPVRKPAAEPAPPLMKPAGPLPLPLELIRQAIEEASDEQGFAHMGSVGNYLNKIRPDFDPRLYGQKKFSDLLGSIRGISPWKNARHREVWARRCMCVHWIENSE